MKIKDMKLDEVAMNPSAFAQAIEEGDAKGVLVGYEFEVCMPAKTIKSAPVEYEKKLDDFFYNDALDMLETSITYNDSGDGKRILSQLNKVLKPKEGAPFASLVDAYKDLAAKREQQLQSAIATLPPEVIKAIKGSAVDYDGHNYAATKKLQTLSQMIAVVDNEIIRGITVSQRKAFLRGGKLFDSANIEIRDVLAHILNDSKPNLIYNSFSKEERRRAQFDYDAKALYNKLPIDEMDDDNYDNYPNYSKASSILKASVEKRFNTKVVVFDEYHQSKKNLTDWYIEPDGSIEPDDSEEGAAEVVTPPLRALAAVNALKDFYALSKELKLYTNQSTGLHINISIPAQLDVLKLAVFLGESYILKIFNREDSEYAISSIKGIASNLDSSQIQTKTNKKIGTSTSINLKKLALVAKSATSDHTASISNNGKYISFRHAGGDYLSEYAKIANAVGRFIRAMVIASNPEAYKKEYLTKLTKLFGENLKPPVPIAKTDLDLYKQLLDRIKTKGLPVIEIHTATVKPVSDMNKVIQQVIRHVGHSEGLTMSQWQIQNTHPNNEAARTILKQRLRRDDLQSELTPIPKKRLVSFVLVPKVASHPATIRKISNTTVDNVVRFSDYTTRTLYTAEMKLLQWNNPAALVIYKAIAKKYIKAKKAASLPTKGKKR
jgi:hypothetical protein